MWLSLGGHIDVEFSEEVVAQVGPDRIKEILIGKITDAISGIAAKEVNQHWNDAEFYSPELAPNAKVLSFPVQNKKSHAPALPLLDNNSVVIDLVEALPGLKSMVRCPVDFACGRRSEIFHMVIHLNDDHQKSREYIADWLETLDVDLKFQEMK